MSDGALDGVVGGMSSPVEWFAEFKRLVLVPRKTPGASDGAEGNVE